MPEEIFPESEDVEVEAVIPPSRSSNTSPVNPLTSWGVKDFNGEWVVVSDNPWRADHDAYGLSKVAATAIFERYPEAAQLITGIDCWAALSGETENPVVVKEKTRVVAPEAVPGAPGS